MYLFGGYAKNPNFWSVTALLYTLNLTVKTILLQSFEFTVQKTGQLNAKKCPFDTQRPNRTPLSTECPRLNNDK